MARLLSLVLSLAIIVGCGGAEPRRITVFAAASTTDVVTELAADFDDALVRTAFGPSSGLARQIVDGAPADVYLSASRRWIAFLRDAGRLDGEPRVFAINRLVCIAHPRTALVAARPANTTELIAHLAPEDRVAIADAGVPAGDYARQGLAAIDELEHVRPYLVGQDDVRGVLRAVASGNAVAGFVYATDARVADVVELFALDPRTHDPIEHFAAVVRGSTDPELARSFVAHLTGPTAREILARAGFSTAPR